MFHIEYYFNNIEI